MNSNSILLRFSWVITNIAVLLIAMPAIAQELSGPEGPSVAIEEKEKDSNYEQCAAFRADINADLGEVLRAGCEPTLAQMSALMDNPSVTWR